MGNGPTARRGEDGQRAQAAREATRKDALLTFAGTPAPCAPPWADMDFSPRRAVRIAVIDRIVVGPPSTAATASTRDASTSGGVLNCGGRGPSRRSSATAMSDLRTFARSTAIQLQ